MNIILLGPQGAGKGTQAVLLAEKLGLVHLEMGRVLRSIARSTNEHASQLKGTLTSGKLVDDEFVRLIAWDFISKHHPKTNGFIFEGYPRSVSQYAHLKDMLATFGRRLDAVINIEISPAETIKRLSDRRTCVVCGEIFNTTSRPSNVENVCDVCGGVLVQREDDTPDAIRRRLDIYRNQTHPVYVTATSEQIGHQVDGEQSIQAVFDDILHYLQKLPNYSEASSVTV